MASYAVPEREWRPGDGPLPVIPDECYPPDSVPLRPVNDCCRCSTVCIQEVNDGCGPNCECGCGGP